MNSTDLLEPILFAEATEKTESLLPSEGEIPGEICGSFLMNGPANFRVGDFTYKHWLDGDGLIRALRIENGKAEHTSKFVQTTKLTEETAAGQRLFRAFGTAFKGDQLRRRIALESPTNVSIYKHGERLFAFGEQALPWELDPETLETIGECNFNDKLVNISPFSAHAKMDEDRGLLCNFGLKYMLSSTQLCYWEFDRDLNCQRELEVDPGGACSVHDFTVSENFASFFLSPYFLKIGDFIRKGKSIHDALDWQADEENVLVVLKRDQAAGDEPIRIPLGVRGYCLHLIQSFESEGRLTIDLFETEEPLYPQYLPLPTLFPTVKPCSFTRLSIDTKTWKLADVVTAPQDVHMDFPAQLDRDQDTVWTLAMPTEPVDESKYYDRILRFDWKRGAVIETFHAPSSCYLAGEPALVPGETDYLICPMWNAQENQTTYLIFKAFELAAGPVAVLPLSTPSHLGFHSTFIPKKC